MSANCTVSSKDLTHFVDTFPDGRNHKALLYNLSVSPAVSSLSKTFLDHHNLGLFVFVRIYDDGRILRMSNCDAWTLKYFGQGLYNDTCFYSDHIHQVRDGQPRYFFWPEESESQIYQGFKTAGFNRGISCYWRAENSTESFSVGRATHLPQQGPMLTSHALDKMHDFVNHFKEQATSSLRIDDEQNMIHTGYRFDADKAAEMRSAEQEKLCKFYQCLGDSLALTDPLLTL